MNPFQRYSAATLLSALPAILSALPTPALAENPGVIYARAIRGVVYIENQIQGKGRVSGSGFLIDRERMLIVTCGHVAGGEAIMDVYFPVRGADGVLIADRELYQKNREILRQHGFYSVARVIAQNSLKDLAILQVKKVPEGAPELELATDDPEMEARLHVLGNPGGRDLWQWTLGSVRQIAQYRRIFREDGQRVDFLALHSFDASFHGNSGGPVLNDEGKVVGVCESGGGEGGMNSTAVYYTEVRDLLDSVKSYRVFSIENKTSGTLHYSTRWGDGDWREAILQPGVSAVHWFATSDAPEIRFDASFEEGYQERSQELETYRADIGHGAAPSKDWDARKYDFRAVPGGVRLFPK